VTTLAASGGSAVEYVAENWGISYLPKSYSCVTLPSFVHSCELSDPLEHAGGGDTGFTGDGDDRPPPVSFDQPVDGGDE
jgi:hypothetical protein